jgi:DNA-damage-inducible protein J
MNTTINIRIDKKTKESAQKTLEAMGLDLSAGIKLFLRQVVVQQCIPFEPRTIGGLTRTQWEVEAAHTLKQGKRYASSKKMMDDVLK